MKSHHIILFWTLLSLSLVAPLRAGDTEPPVPVRTVAPVYPNELRRDGTSGIVVLKCLIDEKGNVADATVEKTSNPAFTQPAIDAIKRWKFKPAKKEGNAVALHVNIPVQFNVGD